MDKPGYTPGPWHPPHFSCDDVACNCASVVCERYAGAIATIHIGNGRPVGDGGNDCPPLEEAKANARLIAAAPDLFETLRDLINAIDTGNLEMNSPEIGGHDDIPPHPWHEEWLHHARAALKETDKEGQGGGA